MVEQPKKEVYDPKKETAAIVEKCLSGKGFVLFAAVETDKKDKQGNSILTFHYTRHKYGFEMLKDARNGFIERAGADMRSTMGNMVV